MKDYDVFEWFLWISLVLAIIYGPKRHRPIRLQDSYEFDVSRTVRPFGTNFCMVTKDHERDRTHTTIRDRFARSCPGMPGLARICRNLPGDCSRVWKGRDRF